MRLRPAAALLLLVAAGCGTNGNAPSPDALIGRDRSPLLDLVVPGGDVLEPVSAGFTTLGNVRSGPAPLSVTFLPLTRGEVRTYRWEFGDGTAPDEQMAPRHVYVRPGSYRVSLAVSGPAGSDSLAIDGYIEVTVAGTGAACTAAEQCAGGLCACGLDASCPTSLRGGFCSRDCGDEDCGEAAVCVDLGRSAVDDAAAAGDGWRRPVCVPACETDKDCARDGYLCRELPAPAPAASVPGRVRGCLGPDPRSVGEVCADTGGLGGGGGCLFGVCLDVGLRGLCSARCEQASDCPEGTACAYFNDGQGAGRCLAICPGPGNCPLAPGDPLLACELAGAAGTHGFTLPGHPPSTRACAPRRCQSDADCAAVGICDDGFCVRRPMIPTDGGPADVVADVPADEVTDAPDADGGADGQGDAGEDGGPDAAVKTKDAG